MPQGKGPTDEQVLHLRDLCRIPSVSTAHDQVTRAAEWLLQTYSHFADETDVLEVAGLPAGLLLSFRAENPSGGLTFYNYFDVTEPGDEAGWSSPPFAPEVRDRRLWARGAAGNKGDLVARLEAVSALRKAGKLRKDAVFLLDAQEELGFPHLEQMLERWGERLRSDAIFWNTGFVNDAGAPTIGCGFKGLVLASLSTRAAEHAGHSGMGLGNSAVGDLLRAVGPLLEDEGLSRFESVGRLKLEDQEALVEAAYESQFLTSIVDHARRGALGSKHADADVRTLTRRALFENTTNVPWITGGARAEPTRYAERAECILDVRLVPPHNADAVGRELSEYFRTRNIDCTPFLSIEPYLASPRDRAKVLTLLKSPLEYAFSQTPRLLPIAPFSAPAALVADRLDTPIFAVGLTDSRSAPHGADESIALETFGKMITFVMALLGSE